MDYNTFMRLRTKYLMYVARLTYIKIHFDQQDIHTFNIITKLENKINIYKNLIARREKQRIFINEEITKEIIYDTL